jgi:uncharacterized membrane protein YesL
VRFWWRTLKHFNLRGYLYIWANLGFVVLSLPLLTMPAAWAALVRLSHLAQTTPHVELGDFWDAFKENFWRATALGLVTILLLLINRSNLYAYRAETGLFIWLLRGLWLSTLFIWFSLQIYLWPLFYEMKNPQLLPALRNAFFMLLRNPLFTSGLWLAMLLIGFLSSILPVAWILLTFSFFACLSASATLDRLKAAGHHNPEHFEPKED